MKISGKGVLIILLFLLLIPALADLVVSPMLPATSTGFSMLRLLTTGYLLHLPYYIGYMLVAFSILYLVKKWKQRHSNEDKHF